MTHWPNGDPRAVAQMIVADPRFHGSTTGEPPSPSLVAQLLMWLGERLAALLQAAGHVLGARSPLNLAIGTTAIVAAVAGIAVLIVRFARIRTRRHRAPAPVTTSIAGGGAETSADLLAVARAAARAERWHAASSALARAASHALDECGRLPFDAARTPGEARRLLRDPAFDAFAHEMTTALFAENAATRERFARLRDAYANVFGQTV